MFVETVWHAHRQTFLSLFAANSGTQRPMSVLCSEWHSSCPGGQEPGEPTTAQAQLVAEGVAAFNKSCLASLWSAHLQNSHDPDSGKLTLAMGLTCCSSCACASP